MRGERISWRNGLRGATRRTWRPALALAALILTGIAAAFAVQVPSWPTAFAPPQPSPGCAGRPIFERAVLHSAAPRYAHVASAVALRGQGLRAFWYEGRHELSRDVRIWTATFQDGRWSAPRPVIGARETAEATGRYVRKLGNAVVYRDAAGELALVYASIGLGGWSAASLNVIRSRDDGASWSSPRRLASTPTFNFSTLVRSPAVALESGLTLMPAYQEFVRQYPEVLLLDRSGRLIGRRRIGASAGAIQPQIVVLDDRRARTYLRGRRGQGVLTSTTSDAAWSWSQFATVDIRSRNNPVAVTRVGADHLLMAYNHLDSSGHPAGPLTLAISADEGVTWRTVLTLGGHAGVARYPWLMSGPDSHYHLIYTHWLAPGSELVHVRFNHDWLQMNGGPPCP